VNQSAAACTFGLSSAAQTVPAAGAGGSVSVSAPSGCSWTAASASTWLAITAGSRGDGPGYVTFSALANDTNASRVGTLLVAGQTFTVSQAGNGCTYALNPANQIMPASGGMGLFDVSAPAGCGWTAVSDASWIRVANGATGSGPGTVTITLDPNTTTAPRQGSVRAGGQAFVVSEQAASLAPPSACSYRVSSTNATVADTETVNSFTINTQAECPWTVSADVTWITVRQPRGTGSAKIEYVLATNPLGDMRTGTITAGGQTFTVKQRGAPASKRRN
jgi:hypothetical protein